MAYPNSNESLSFPTANTTAILPQTSPLTSSLLMLDKELYEHRVNDLKKYIGIHEYEDENDVDISQEARSAVASKISSIVSTNNTRQHCLRAVQLSDLLFKILNQNRRIGQGSPQAQNIYALLIERKSIVQKINDIEKEVGILIDQTYTKIEELKRMSKEQATIGKKIEKKDKPRKSNVQSQNMLEKIEKKKDRIEAISFLARRIIFASKIDWSEDPEIKDLLFSFCEPIPE